MNYSTPNRRAWSVTYPRKEQSSNLAKRKFGSMNQCRAWTQVT